MRVLAVRGRNLASLADEFVVDLTAEPLAGAGLFAVTGETGAGKSTILDALCLALYGDYPRLASGGREEAPDPGGPAIGGRDARAILRRGAASGHAEADFVGVDGTGYRARWEVARARGRAGGRLQPEARLLSRLDDGSPVAIGKRQVLEAVERATGLDFGQFRRTALLAQGEFDAFLLAADGERAELLERITGTDVYATVSTRVHEGTEARRHDVADLERARRDVGALDEAARAGLDAEGRRARAELAEAVARRGAAADRLATIRRGDAALAALAGAERAVVEASMAWDAAAGDRATLDAVEAAEPLRAVVAGLDAASATRRASDTTPRPPMRWPSRPTARPPRPARGSRPTGRAPSGSTPTPRPRPPSTRRRWRSRGRPGTRLRAIVGGWSRSRASSPSDRESGPRRPPRRAHAPGRRCWPTKPRWPPP